MSDIGLVGRCLVIGLVYMILFIVIASVGEAIGVLAVPTVFVDITIVLLSAFIGGILTTLIVGTTSLKLNLPIGQRVGVMFLTTYMLSYLIQAPETAFFTTTSLSFQIFIIVQYLVVSLVLAILVGFLFKPSRILTGLSTELKSYFAQRSRKDWIWRFLLAAVLFFPIYFFFGWVFSPITGPYYNNPETGLNLVIPSSESFLGIFLGVEITRGLIYALTMVPLLAVLRMSRWRLGLWMGLIIAIVGAVVPQVVNVSWPLPLRIGHGIEMVLDSFAQGLMMAWLLYVKK